MADNPYSSPAPVNDAQQPPQSFLIPMLKLFAVLGLAVVTIGLFMPLERGREAARRTQCKNNLKQIGLALHLYHDVHHAFPPAYTVDANGRRLHSWRTLILPWMEQQALYNSLDLSKPWNDPANAEAFKTMPHQFRCPGSKLLPPCFTSYVAVVGADACFHPTEPRPISDITDGTSNTVMVIEVAQKHTVHWMSPLDADEQVVLCFSSDDQLAHTGGVQGALADGSVRYISENITPEARRALISINGKETLGEY